MSNSQKKWTRLYQKRPTYHRYIKIRQVAGNPTIHDTILFFVLSFSVAAVKTVELKPRPVQCVIYKTLQECQHSQSGNNFCISAGHNFSGPKCKILHSVNGTIFCKDHTAAHRCYSPLLMWWQAIPKTAFYQAECNLWQNLRAAIMCYKMQNDWCKAQLQLCHSNFETLTAGSKTKCFSSAMKNYFLMMTIFT